jgi:hypothetical protein
MCNAYYSKKQYFYSFNDNKPVDVWRGIHYVRFESIQHKAQAQSRIVKRLRVRLYQILRLNLQAFLDDPLRK